MSVLLQAVGDINSNNHFSNTVVHNILYRNIKPYVMSTVYKDIKDIFGKDKVHAWGTLPTKGNNSQYKKIKPGDLVLFSSKAILYIWELSIMHLLIWVWQVIYGERKME